MDYETWIEEGKKSYTDLLIAKTLEILETYKPESLPEKVQETIERILTETYTKLKNVKFRS